ncbi:MAG: nuclear transport factor 2 family protein [Gemmatimonadaceae bacterium]
MRVSITAITLALGVSVASAQKAPPAPKAERALLQLEDDWTRGLIRRDAALFRRLIAPRWVYTDERGTFNREQVIAEYTTGNDTVTSASNEGMKVNVYRDAAVVTGILVTTGRGSSGPFQHRYRYTDTWARLAGRWQCVASQDFDIPR